MAIDALIAARLRGELAARHESILAQGRVDRPRI
jgi:hypothetical protein